MMALIIVLVLKNVCNPGIVMAGVPVLAAFCMGFSVKEIAGFINGGFGMVVGTLCIMLFALAYFGILHEAGVFKAMVGFIMKRLKNSVLTVLLATALVTFCTQLDGSGMTTALCTVPPLRPVYEKMNIRREALLLIEGLGSGVLTLIPWAPGLLEACAYAKIDINDVFR